MLHMALKFNTYDAILIPSSLALVLLFCILVFLPASSLLQSVGDYMIMLTHFFILPTIYLATKTPWLAYIIGATCFFSLLYHLVSIEYNGNVVDEKLKIQFQALDESAQTILIWMSTILFLFDDMPYIGLPFLMVVGLITAIFGDEKILFADVDTLLNGLAIISTLIFICFRLFESNCKMDTRFFTLKRIWQFIFIGLGYFVLAFSFYFLGTSISNYAGEKEITIYNYLHASWHICAYMALFYIFRSRVQRCYTLLSAVRIKRTQFAIRQP